MIKSNKHQHINMKQTNDYRDELFAEMEIMLHHQLGQLNLLDSLEIIDYDQILGMLIKNQILQSQEDQNPKIEQIFQNSLWQTNFTIQCLNQMQKDYDLHSLIRQLLTLSEGYFNIEKTTYVEIQKLFKYQGYFIYACENYSLAYEVGVQAFEFQNRFKIKHVMTFIDLRFDSNSYQQLTQSIQEYHNTLKLNPKKRLSFQNIEINPQIIVQKKDRTQYQEVFLFAKSDKWSDLLFTKIQNQSNMKWIPNEFCSQNQIDPIKCQQSQNQIIKQNQLILKQYAYFPHTLLILNILTEIPDFKYKTTDQQRQIIGNKLSSISIGRSGTGKTLSQILRIFLGELNFKGKLKQYGAERPQILFNTYQQGNTGLHQMYTTLNPVLIGEVRRYYYQLGNIVTKHLQRINKNNEKMYTESTLNIQSILQESLLMNEAMRKETLQDHKNIDYQQDRGEIDNIQKLSNLQDCHFPVFLTIQKLLLMIDNSISKPYFKNDYFQNQFKRTGRAGWDDGSAVHINLEMKNKITLGSTTKSVFQQSKQNNSNTNSNKKIQVIQVDYRYFMTRFWPSIKKMHAQTEDNRGFMNLVWTQIYSIIKGSQYSHTYPDNAIPKCIYLRENKDIYEQSTLNTIYDYYLLYEQWKKEKQLFDQMDLVNYLLNQIDAGEYAGTPIHYLTIDEIQDLPHALIELLTKITEQSLQLCGDTAQNIVQGVGFRFQDLKNIFKNQIQAGETKFLKFDFYQLTVNFRAHNNLLQLANNVVSLLEIFFPKSIDRLNKEVSNSPGPKPFLVESRDENVLISLLGKQFNNKSHEQIEFGCNQVILVKNDEAKAKIPQALQNALILTVYESKGLEFDDVILYNYFSDDNLSKDKWNIINNLFIEETMQDLQNYSDHQQSEQSKDCSIITLKYSNSVLVRKLRIKPSFRTFDLSNFNDLCAELKMLYVAITRPKKRLIIFDNDTSRREAIQTLWNQLGLINMDDKQFIEFTPQRDEQGVVPKQEWIDVGHRMFENKYYDQAVKCFKMAGDDTEFIKSLAYANATKAQQLQYEYEQRYADSPKYNVKQKDQFKANYLNKFQDAAQCFEKILMYKMSGDCYFSGQKYENALIQYIKCEYWVEAAECAQKSQKYLVSAVLFFKAEIYDLGLRMIENTNQTIYIMSALLICRQNISDDSMEQSLCKYFPKYVKLLQNCLDKKGEIQKYPNLNEDIQIIIHNCQDYQQQFITIIFYFDSFQIKITNLEDFIRELIQSIQHFSRHFIQLIQKQNINYDILKYQKAIEQRISTIEQQEFVFDILDYFKLRKMQKFFSDQNSQHEKMAISQLFDKSILYQDQNISQFKDEISEVKQYAFELVTSIPKIGQNVFFYFNLLTLGFEEQMKYLLIGRICKKIKSSINSLLLKSTLQNIFSLQSELQEVCLLFRNFNLPLQFKFISRSPEQQKLFELYQEIVQQKQVKFQLEYFQNQLAQINNKNLYLDINADYQIQLGSLPNFLENLKRLNEIQMQYLLASSYIINLIKQCSKNDKNLQLFEQLLHLDQPLVEQFMVFVMMCVKILKYNVCIRQQKLTIQAIGLLFGFQIPTNNALRYFGQSYVFITTSSYFFKDFKTIQKFCVSFDKSVYIIESQFVLRKVRKYFKDFISEYSRRYIQLQEEKDQYFLFNYYVLKQNEIQLSKQLLSYGTDQFFFQEKWLQFLIKMKQFKLDHQKIQENIYLDYALSYFKETTFTQGKHQQHKKLYRGFQISNIVQTQRYSCEILEHLQHLNTSLNQYYSLSYDYVKFLQISNKYYSIYKTLNVMKYFQYLFKNGFKDIYLKDLYLISLNIIFSYKSTQCKNTEKKIGFKVLLPSTIMLDLPQILQNDNFTILVEEFDMQKIDFERIIEKFYDILIDYSEIQKKKFELIYIILCTLALNININLVNLEEKINKYPPKFYKSKNGSLLENLLSIINQKQTSTADKRISIISSIPRVDLSFTQKNIRLLYEDQININSYLQYNLSDPQISEGAFKTIFDKNDIQTRFTLNKMEKPYFRPEKLQEPQTTTSYTLINENRIKLIELLYSKYIEKSIHFHNVSDQIRQLNALEDTVDCSIFSPNFNFKINNNNIESIIHRLKLQSKNIDEWIQEKVKEKENEKEKEKEKKRSLQQSQIYLRNQNGHEEYQISTN